VRGNRSLPALEVLVELAARRAALGVNVAAAKFLAGREVEDPGREEEMLAWVADRLKATGVSQGAGLAFFLDQIAASKVIQRGLYARWRAHPAQALANSRDLAREVRPELDALNDEMLPLVVHAADLAPAPYGHLGPVRPRAEDKPVPERLARVAAGGGWSCAAVAPRAGLGRPERAGSP
jgi:chorismate mutase